MLRHPFVPGRCVRSPDRGIQIQCLIEKLKDWVLSEEMVELRGEFALVITQLEPMSVATGVKVVAAF